MDAAYSSSDDCETLKLRGIRNYTPLETQNCASREKLIQTQRKSFTKHVMTLACARVGASANILVPYYTHFTVYSVGIGTSASARVQTCGRLLDQWASAPWVNSSVICRCNGVAFQADRPTCTMTVHISIDIIFGETSGRLHVTRCFMTQPISRRSAADVCWKLIPAVCCHSSDDWQPFACR